MQLVKPTSILQSPWNQELGIRAAPATALLCIESVLGQQEIQLSFFCCRGSRWKRTVQRGRPDRVSASKWEGVSTMILKRFVYRWLVDHALILEIRYSCTSSIVTAGDSPAWFLSLTSCKLSLGLPLAERVIPARICLGHYLTFSKAHGRLRTGLIIEERGWGWDECDWGSWYVGWCTSWVWTGIGRGQRSQWYIQVGGSDHYDVPQQHCQGCAAILSRKMMRWRLDNRCKIVDERSRMWGVLVGLWIKWALHHIP